jgi:hypothetical protein
MFVKALHGGGLQNCRTKENKNRWCRGGELNAEWVLKTCKLLNAGKREKQESRRLTDFRDVIGTRKNIRFFVASWYTPAVNWFALHTYIATWVSRAITILLALFKKNQIRSRSLLKKTFFNTRASFFQKI